MYVFLLGARAVSYIHATKGQCLLHLKISSRQNKQLVKSGGQQEVKGVLVLLMKCQGRLQVFMYRTAICAEYVYFVVYVYMLCMCTYVSC